MSLGLITATLGEVPPPPARGVLAPPQPCEMDPMTRGVPTLAYLAAHALKARGGYRAELARLPATAGAMAAPDAHGRARARIHTRAGRAWPLQPPRARCSVIHLVPARAVLTWSARSQWTGCATARLRRHCCRHRARCGDGADARGRTRPRVRLADASVRLGASGPQPRTHDGRNSVSAGLQPVARLYLSAATLVIVPSNLVEQWVAEIHKVRGRGGVPAREAAGRRRAGGWGRGGRGIRKESVS